MFSLLKKNTNQTQKKVEFTIQGMHCSSCAMNIDDALEDVAGVSRASTSYAKGKTVVEYDPEKVTLSQLKVVIQEVGYKIAD